MEWTKEQMEETYQQVVKKAVTDEEFRKELLANPNEAIGKVAGIPVPADFRICIVEQDPSYQATFLLPPMLPEDVSDEDLEAVAGGDCVQDVDICGAQGCGVRGK
ncbi:NHLP leader peptide family RiPP precursor [Selenomonas sp. AB3002]|uniref:NHLP leader peptide family RiPP precursor n=1 Tax=Selenomonas sp. AB3002 TaxID=1392502 RepID=UPI00068B3257